MTTKKKATVSWSGGKDSAFALYKVLQLNEYEVVSLHTVFDSASKRVSMHGVKEELIEQQANCLNIPLHKLYLEASDSHVAYQFLMQQFYSTCQSMGIDTIVYGDIFLEDLRSYRLKLLEGSALNALFPLWGQNTSRMMHDFIDAGFKTILCAVNSDYFNSSDLGKTVDNNFLTKLHKSVDPCGEYGEFHTFVYDGPNFIKAVNFITDTVVEKDYTYNTLGNDGQEKLIRTRYFFVEILNGS